MKKIIPWEIILGLALIASSATLYGFHYFIFRDTHHIFIYMIGDVAFLPIEVLLVTLVIHRILHMREKRVLLRKLNMVIGAFFSEVGTELLRLCIPCDTKSDNITKQLLIDTTWDEQKFFLVTKTLKSHDPHIVVNTEKFITIGKLLTEKRSFLVSLLENQNLLEHDAFTNVLWAVFHFSDELSRRKDISSLSEKDREHLALDIKRVYTQIIAAWIDYMKHLKSDYPYLFSFALRTNPFNKTSSVEF